MNIESIYHVFYRLFRRRRMRRFVETFRPTAQTRILDVGGTYYNWRYVDTNPHITLLNITETTIPEDHRAHVEFVTGDGTELPFDDHAFDICFSNSVIEHVGTLKNQQHFAAELRRVGKHVWMQTPAKCFPIEPHYLAPFIHWFPRRVQEKLIRNFTVRGWLTRPSAGEVRGFLDEIRLLNSREVAELFPDCRIHAERFMGWPKAYVAVREFEG